MRSRFIRVAAALLSLGLASSVHTQTSDPLQAIKDTLGSDQGSSILQNVLGKGDGTGKTSDKKLENPDDSTLQKGSNQQMDPVRHIKKEETFDGRVLRQSDEDPELRADDSVLIELTPVELARLPRMRPTTKITRTAAAAITVTLLLTALPWPMECQALTVEPI